MSHLPGRAASIRRDLEVRRVLDDAVVTRVEYVAVVCNGCGRLEEASTVDALAEKVRGWRITREPADADYCPRCLT